MTRFINKLIIVVGIFINGTLISGCEETTGSGPMDAITDGAFYNVLLQNGADENGDGLISKEEALRLKSLYVYDYDNEVKSLDGLEYFPNLTELHCGGETLSEIDVSKNIKLERLFIGNTKISSLDISKNTSLIELYCVDNMLTSMDVSNNTSLIYLACADNQLNNLDVSQNINLLCLICGGNLIVSLDLSNNFNLGDDYYPPYDSWCHEPVLNIRNMPSLGQVCVRTTPFPPDGLWLCKDGSPNVYFTSENNN
jgi:hypothetical protein